VPVNERHGEKSLTRMAILRYEDLPVYPVSAALPLADGQGRCEYVQFELIPSAFG
jgi:hypothetical protein